jgi:hypothetical protein
MYYKATNPLPVTLHIIVICGIGLLLGLVSVWVSPFLLLAATAGMIYFIIAWLWPEFAILIILVLTSTVIDINIIPSVPIGIGHLIVTDFLLFIPLGILLLRNWVAGNSFIHTPLDLPLLAFYVVAIISTLIAILTSYTTFNRSLTEVRIVNFYLIFFIVTNLVQDKQRLQRLLKGIFLMAVLVALAMIAQFAVGNALTILPGRVEALGEAGVTAPDVTRVLPPGQSLVLVALVAFFVLLITNDKESRPFVRFLQIFIVGLAVLITFNRSFWVAVALALLLVGILVSIRDKVRYATVIAWIVTGTLIVLITISALNNNQTQALVENSVVRFSTLFDPGTLVSSSLQDRYVEDSYAIPQIIAHPFIGTGLGSDYRPFDHRIDFPPITWDKYAYIHNGHYWVILKTGFIGYGFLIWLLLLAVKRGFQTWPQIEDPLQKGVILAFSSMIVGLLAMAVVNPAFEAFDWTPVIGIMLGVIEVIIRLHQKELPNSLSQDSGR